MNNQVIKNFKNPTNRYGAAPFWFLNGDLTQEELSWQVKEMHEKGLFGYVMHSRYGRRLDYFSEEFFDRIGHIIKLSEQLGMSAIIYDEDDWPSGMSGTKVLDDHPEYKHKQLSISWFECAKDEEIDRELPVGEVVNVFGCSFNERAEELSLSELNSFTSVLPSVKNGRLTLKNSEGYEMVMVFMMETVSGYMPTTTYPKKKGFRAQPDSWGWYFPYGEYVDLFNPDAVDYFIKTTGDEYKKRFGNHFGKAVEYFYTDEPGFYTVMRGDDTTVPWSDIFTQSFDNKHEYRIADYLPALVCGIGEKTSRVRFDFWAHVTDLFENNYIKKYRDWCKANGLKLTGHFRLCFPQLVWQRNYAGNAINLFKHMDAPGVDRLDTPGMNDVFATKDCSWQIEDKIASSVGHQYGIERRMTEAFAIAGWEYRFADMKRVTDWQYMMGMNFLVPHAFHYSVSGQRKRECPPSLFYQNPQWQKFKVFSDYLCRLGEMMIGAKHVANIAVLYPMTTIWSDDVPKADVDNIINNIDRDFGYITDMLLRNQLDYDILGEHEFQHSTVLDGKIAIGEASYQLMIVPPMITIDVQTEEKIKAFVESGGKVIFLSLPPHKNIEGQSLKYLNDLVETTFDLKIDTLLSDYSLEKNTNIAQKGLENQIGLVAAGVMKDTDPKTEIISMVEDMIVRDIDIDCVDDVCNVYYNHHKRDLSDLYFIVNSDEDMAHDLDITFNISGKPYYYDAEKGTVKEALFFESLGDKIKMNIRLAPLKSVFIVFENQPVKENLFIKSNLDVLSCDENVLKGTVLGDEQGYIIYNHNGKQQRQTIDIEKKNVVPLNEGWTKTLEQPNVLIIDKWLMIQNEVEDDQPLPAWNEGWRSKIKYIGEFYVENPGMNLKAVFDRIPQIVYDEQVQPVPIYINDVEIKQLQNSNFLDHEMREVDITELVHEGINTIMISYDHKLYAFEGKTGVENVSMMWDQAYIIGDFDLEKRENSFVIIPSKPNIQIGSWVNQGLPFYNGCVKYLSSINLYEEQLKDTRCTIDCGLVKECVDIYVNGQFVDSRIWMPFNADITDYLKSGENRIELHVRNTPKNIMQKVSADCGLQDDVCLRFKPIVKVDLSGLK